MAIRCSIHDAPMFGATIVSLVGWLIFTVGFAILLSDKEYPVFGDKQEVNALTFVHFGVAIFGALSNIFSMLYSLCSSKTAGNVFLKSALTVVTLLVMLFAAAAANDYGRILYIDQLATNKANAVLNNINVEIKSKVPDSLRVAISGAIIFLLTDTTKILLLIYGKRRSTNTTPTTSGNWKNRPGRQV